MSESSRVVPSSPVEPSRVVPPVPPIGGRGRLVQGQSHGDDCWDDSREPFGDQSIPKADVLRERDALLVQLGAELEAERETQGLSVAEQARRAGIAKRTLVHLRQAECDPKLGTLVAAARALGCRWVIALVPERAAAPSPRKSSPCVSVRPSVI